MTADELQGKYDELVEALSTCDHSEIDDINDELDIIEAELEFRRDQGEI